MLHSGIQKSASARAQKYVYTCAGMPATQCSCPSGTLTSCFTWFTCVSCRAVPCHTVSCHGSVPSLKLRGRFELQYRAQLIFTGACVRACVAHVCIVRAEAIRFGVVRRGVVQRGAVRGGAVRCRTPNACLHGHAWCARVGSHTQLHTHVNACTGAPAPAYTRLCMYACMRTAPHRTTSHHTALQRSA